MEATFELKMSAARARDLFGRWRCSIERLDAHTCNITFSDQDEWKRFEDYCDREGIDCRLV